MQALSCNAAVLADGLPWKVMFHGFLAGTITVPIHFAVSRPQSSVSWADGLISALFRLLLKKKKKSDLVLTPRAIDSMLRKPFATFDEAQKARGRERAGLLTQTN